MAVTDAQIREEVRARFPRWAYLLDNSEVAPLLFQLGRGTLDEAEAVARIQNTNFWKQTSDTLRRWQTLRALDPAQSKRLVTDRGLVLRQLAAQMGIQIRGKDFARFSRWTLGNLGIEGVSEAQLRAHLGNYARGTGQIPTEFRSEMKQLTSKYLVGVPPRDFDWWTRALSSGTRSKEQYEGMLRARAKGKYPALSTLIDQGILPDDYFAGHRQVIAEEMEVSEANIDLLKNPTWKKITGIHTKEGKRPMTETETLEYVRGLPQWRKTGRANEMAAELTTTLLEAFGRRA